MPQLDEIVGRENIQQVLDLNKALNDLSEVHLRLVKSTKEVRSDIQANVDSFTKLKVVQDQTAEQTKKLGEAEKEAAKIAKDQTAAVAALEKQRQAAYAQMAKQEAKEKELAAAINMEVKSVDDARKQNEALHKARNKVNLSTAEGKKQADAYNKTINKNTEFIRANVDAVTKQKMNIGNYQSAMQGLPGPIGRASSALGTMGAAMKALMLNPIIAFISALVLGLKLLYDAFKSTDEGADKLEQTTGALAASWKVITDRVGQVLTGNMKLSDSFSGLTEEILKTASVAANYAATMDAINERNTLYISDQAKLKKEESELTRVYKDATLSTEERIGAYQRVLDIETELMEFKKSQAAEVYRAELVNASLVQQGSAFTIAQIQEFIEMDAARAEQLKSNDPAWKAFWNSNQENIGRLENAYANLTNVETEYFDATAKKFGVMQNFKKQLSEEEIRQNAEAVRDKQEAETEKVNAAKEAKDRRIEIMNEEIAYEADLYDKELKAKAKAAEDFVNILADYRDEGESLDFDNHQEKLKWIEEEKQATLEAEAEKLQAKQAAVAQAQAIGQTLLDFNQFVIDTETQKLEQAKAYELQLAGDNVEKRTEIEKKYEKESAKLKTKQARADKAQSLFSAIMKTAQAVLSGLAYGPPLGYVFAALNAVLGAIQVGVIASQPIPQFFKGTQSAPDGVISVAEKGQELIKTRSGKTLLARNRTLLSGMKGAQIYSNQETEAILKAGRGGYDSKELRDTLKENNRELIRTIQNKREIHIQAPQGSRITERKGDFFTHYWNKKI